MKFQLAIWGFVCCALAGGVSLVKAQSNVDYVNMFIGSTGSHNTEYGGTTPAVSEPFGMTQWCAATRINGISRTAYNYNDTHLLGFVATHQPAIWMGDYGFFTLMPQVGILNLEPEKRAVKMDHAQEIATPYYYKIGYSDVQGHALKTEFTATSRCSFFRFNYPSTEKAILFLEAGREKEGGSIEILPDKQEIRICNKERHDSHLGPRLYNFKGCYVLKFSRPFSQYGTWNEVKVSEMQSKEEGAHVGGYIEFELGTEVVEVRIGSSFIDFEQASVNLEKEIPASVSFEQTKKKVKAAWESNLDKIRIKGATDDDATIFYTAFFRHYAIST